MSTDGIPEQRSWCVVEVDPEFNVDVSPEVLAVMKAAATENLSYQWRDNERPHPGDAFIMERESTRFWFEHVQALGDIAFGLTRYADSTEYSMVEMQINCPPEMAGTLTAALEERRRLGEAAAQIAAIFIEKEQLFEGLDAPPRYADADEWLHSLAP